MMTGVAGEQNTGHTTFDEWDSERPGCSGLSSPLRWWVLIGTWGKARRGNLCVAARRRKGAFDSYPEEAGRTILRSRCRTFRT